ncbi:hypothetical protein EGR_03706 [Echinococcus granulosus]|uniref:Uncharacterized protein n=1 Tax=Echinococcus granulosus TaxID=6210 RepID=W6UJV5_ECHGR|nr:hypothetical protein EGR_03706 [Echinococcus granulosus]EUB61416.1 hypothetical protein EGR_03706 [Echinococcus granulosus]
MNLLNLLVALNFTTVIFDYLILNTINPNNRQETTEISCMEQYEFLRSLANESLMKKTKLKPSKRNFQPYQLDKFPKQKESLPELLELPSMCEQYLQKSLTQLNPRLKSERICITFIRSSRHSCEGVLISYYKCVSQCMQAKAVTSFPSFEITKEKKKLIAAFSTERQIILCAKSVLWGSVFCLKPKVPLEF